MPSKGSLEVHCTFARFIFHNSRLSQDSAFCVLETLTLNATSQQTASKETRLAAEYLEIGYQY